MLNREKYAKEILDIVCNGEDVAVVDGKPRRCTGTPCDTCVLCGNCPKRFKHWANSEYVEPSVDWSKIPVDTPILVKNFEWETWKKRYFAGYKGGHIYAWSNGATSWSADVCKISWNFAKLAESEE